MSKALFIARHPSPIGDLLIVFDTNDKVHALDFDDYEDRMHRLLGRYKGKEGRDFTLTSADPTQWVRRCLDEYFRGKIDALNGLSVDTGGSRFQNDVWKALRKIPAGATWSYGTLAKKIRRPKAVRAVGAANAANPVGIVLPCHRVIGADGSLTGYGGGIERKRWLLEHEGAIVS